VEYAVDRSGYRVRTLEDPVDHERPSIVLTGESVMFGEGLQWDESIGGQIAALTGLQVANLAVQGFATDQSYLRLAAELPRFKRPVAIVSLFIPTLFGRNLDVDRPHLRPGLVWTPAVAHGRLHALAKLLVPFRYTRTVDRGVLVTQEVLRSTLALAQARGALPLILVPQFGQEDAFERTWRQRVLDEAALPYLRLKFEDNWRLAGDLHPNAATARAIAQAIVERLGGRPADARRARLPAPTHTRLHAVEQLLLR
jgi:hypothetical protein